MDTKAKFGRLKWDLLVLSIIGLLCILYFYKVVFSDKILVHGDFQSAVTVKEDIIYNLSSSQVNGPKIPLLLFFELPLSYAIPDILSEKVFWVLILFISASVVFFANKYFVTRVFDCKSQFKLSIAALIGTLIFLFNPWTIDRFHHAYWLVLSLVSSYGLLASIDYLLYSRFSLKQVLLSSILLLFIGTQPQSFIIYFIPLIFLYFLLKLLSERGPFLTRISTKKTALFITLVFLLNIFWLMPFVATIFVGNSTPQSYGFVIENIALMSRRGTILNSLSANSGYVFGPPYTESYSINFLGTNIWVILMVLPAIIGSAALLLLRNRQVKRAFYLFLFSALFMISVIISTGSKLPVFGSLYQWIFLNSPLGWVIRDPSKNTGLFIISLSILISLLTFFILLKKGKKSIMATILIVIVALSWGWPALTGDLNGHLTPSLIPYPQDLQDTISYLKNQPDIDRYNIFWYTPSSAEFSLESVPELSSSSLNVLKLPNPYLNFIAGLAQEKDEYALLRFFGNLSVKYLIIRHDITSDSSSILSENIDSLQNVLDKYEVANIGNFSICVLPSSKQLADTEAVITYSTSPEIGKMLQFINVVSMPYYNDMYILSDTCIDNLLGQNDIITPTTQHHNPSECWSFAAFTDSWLANFKEYLDDFNLTNKQTFYDSNIVFTWANASSLDIKVQVSETTDYVFYTRLFENQQGGQIRLELDGNNFTINTKSQINKFSWVNIGNLELSKGTHDLKLTNIHGFNAINEFSLIPQVEYEANLNNVCQNLEGKPLLYYLDRSDMLEENTTLYSEVDILKPANYTLLLNAAGYPKVEVEQQEYNALSKQASLTDFGQIYLSQGQHKIAITYTDESSVQKFLNATEIWLYSSTENYSLYNILNPSTNKVTILNYQKIDPTTYHLEVNATQSFMLSFAKTYDPLWIATVNGEKVEPITLYSLITGFWVNQTGLLEISINYEPQRWFNYGSYISTISILALILYLTSVTLIGFTKKRKIIKTAPF